jgi:hypothetical protein
MVNPAFYGELPSGGGVVFQAESGRALAALIEGIVRPIPQERAEKLSFSRRWDAGDGLRRYLELRPRNVSSDDSSASTIRRFTSEGIWLPKRFR